MESINLLPVIARASGRSSKHQRSPWLLDAPPSEHDHRVREGKAIILLDGKLIVEVDGVTHGSEREALRDAQRTLVLDSLGFRVIRVANVDIYENLAGVLEMIYHELCHD